MNRKYQISKNRICGNCGWHPRFSEKPAGPGSARCPAASETGRPIVHRDTQAYSGWIAGKGRE